MLVLALPSGAHSCSRQPPRSLLFLCFCLALTQLIKAIPKEHLSAGGLSFSGLAAQELPAAAVASLERCSGQPLGQRPEVSEGAWLGTCRTGQRECFPFLGCYPFLPRPEPRCTSCRYFPLPSPPELLHSTSCMAGSCGGQYRAASRLWRAPRDQELSARLGASSGSCRCVGTVCECVWLQCAAPLCVRCADFLCLH